MTELAVLTEERSCPGCGIVIDESAERCECGEHVCSGCGAAVSEFEQGCCAFCRMADRGDGQLLSHDSRGWVEGTEIVRDRYGRRPKRVEHRIPCGCGCGMAAVPRTDDLEEAIMADVDEEIRRQRELLDSLDRGEPMRAAPRRKGGRPQTWTKERIIFAIQAWAGRYGAPPASWQWQAAGDDHPSQGTVKKRFGSWANGVEAAGFPRPQVGKRSRVAEPLTHRGQADGSGFAASDEEPKPEPAPPANGDLRSATLSLIASARTFLDAWERELD